MGSEPTERARTNFSNFPTVSRPKRRREKEKRKSGEGEGKWTKRNAGAEEKMGRPRRDQVRALPEADGPLLRAYPGAPGSQLLQQAGRVAPGLQLGQPLLHATETAAEPPGSAELGQTVLLVSQQGALRGIQGAEGHLQGDQGVDERGARLPELEPCPHQEVAAVRLRSRLGSQAGGGPQMLGAAGGPWGSEARLPIPCLLGWIFPLQYLLPLVFEHSVLCVCNYTMGLKKIFIWLC